MSRKSIAFLAAAALLLPAGALRAEQAAEGQAAQPAAPAPQAAPQTSPQLELTNVSVMVDDQDEALRFYTEKLGLEKRFDFLYGEGKKLRWLSVGAKGQKVEILLQKADPAKPRDLEGDENGFSWVFKADDCQQTYEALTARGVAFKVPPEPRSWGLQGTFADPYGNEFLLVCPPAKKG